MHGLFVFSCMYVAVCILFLFEFLLFDVQKALAEALTMVAALHR